MSDTRLHRSHAARRAALAKLLAERDLDAVLITDLCNIRYLTGFTGSNAALLVHAAGDERSVFCTDGRYTAQAAVEVPDLTTVIERASVAAVARYAGAHRGEFGRTGFESQHVSVDAFDALTKQAEGVELARAPGLVEQLRMIKDDAEIEALRMACAAADRALADLIEHGGARPGRSERQVARDLENRMLDHGASGPAFTSIVAAGVNSAIPHHRPADALLARGDLVKLDFGAVVDGYHSDMTRMLVLGKPADWQVELHELVLTAQERAVAAVRSGAENAKVDAVARGMIERAGHAEHFPHGLGHGVGLQVHEAPGLGKTAAGTLSAGMAVTVEPGVYLAGRGGVRIEDTVVVRDDGCEVLTLSTKDLVTV